MHHTNYKPLVYYSSIILLLFFHLSACQNSIEKVEQFSEQLETAVETISDVNILYSENAHVKVRLEAPKLHRYKTDTPYVEFTEGLKVSFFNDSTSQTVSSILTAKYGIRYEILNKTYLKDSVIWENQQKNERLETEEMLWDEKAATITSEANVKVTTDKEVIYSQGFEGAQDFSQYTFKEVTAVLQVDPKEFED